MVKLKSILFLSIVCFAFMSDICSANQNSFLPMKDEWRQISVEGKQVPVVYRAAIGKMQGAAIIIQGSSEQTLVEYKGLAFLRKQLPAKGWATLGINIPNGKKLPELSAEEQLEQATLLLKNEGVQVAYVILYEGSAAKLFKHFIDKSVRNINGIILISSFTSNDEDYKTLIENIKSWRMFVFDIVAQFDYGYVLKDFNLRKDIFKKVSSYYRSFTLPGAQAEYLDSSADLMRWVRGWMMRQANLKPIVNRPDGLKQIPLNP